MYIDSLDIKARVIKARVLVLAAETMNKHALS